MTTFKDALKMISGESNACLPNGLFKAAPLKLFIIIYRSSLRADFIIKFTFWENYVYSFSFAYLPIIWGELRKRCNDNQLRVLFVRDA